MTGDEFLAAARIAARLLREPAVAAAWDAPSALPEFSVGGLAGHLAYQVLAVPEALSGPVPEEPVITLLDHYGRVEWIGAGPEAEINVRIRAGGERVGAEGPETLAERIDATVAELADAFAVGEDRPVRIPLWGPWSLRLGDLLVTRTMELVVHADDLAVSVGVPTPEFSDGAVTAVVALLSRLAVRRHGGTAVVRALSRAERAPATIAAI
ncbi:maleylpyruvate isomerase N-terminal domain-containing protein [Amycolatopsis sp. NPDC059027]|uniref:maleylpyruvate isomerase N-terminal domain-containing protein n=1 Tax=unclassified Amycolatopsis TaxID=2618356 RepID=UPI0036717002